MSEIKPKKKNTIGNKVVEWFPSHHSDPTKAKEQERGLQEAIDFVVPQTKLDLAFFALPGMGKFLGKPIIKRVGKSFIKDFNLWKDAQGREGNEMLQRNYAKAMGVSPTLENVKKSKKWLNNWMKTYRGTKIEKAKAGIKTQNLDDIPVELQEFSEGSFGSYSPEKNKIKMNVDLDDYNKGSKSSISKNLSLDKFTQSVGVHEYFHGMHFGKDYALGKHVSKLIDDALDISRATEGANVLPNAFHWSVANKAEVQIGKDKLGYFSEGTEIYARIMQLRFELGETASNLTSKFVKLGKRLKYTSQPYSELKTVLSDKQIERLYNSLPALVPLGAMPLSENKIGKN
tara:strand:+ start:4283 stop:5314 length:1032 start_codon:yes stop_codon:yes gene_type:complete